MPTSQSEGASVSPPTLTARFERLPFTSYQKKLALILATCFAADAVDLIMLSYLLAPVSHDLHFSNGQAGLAGTAVFAGIGIGATIAGFLSDRFGRRPILAYTMILWGVSSLLTAFSWNFSSFITFRFITGIGLGAELPIAFALVAEFMPSTHRASVAGGMHMASQGSAVVFNLVSFLIIFLIGGAMGWRMMFVVMFLVALAALYIRRGLPESPRWYEAKGQLQDAEKAMSEFEQAVEKAYRQPLPAPAHDAARKPKLEIRAGFRDLFSSGYTKRTLFVWAFWFMTLMAYYGISVWVGKLLVDRGLSVASSVGVGAAISFGGVPAAWTTGYFLEKIGRKPTIVTALVLFSAAAFGYGQASSVAMLVAAGAVMYFFQVSVGTSLYAYSLELFPTRVRATGLGTASTVGRIGAVTGPLLVLPIVEIWGFTGAFIVFSGCLGLSAILVLLFGPETRHRSIDEVSA